MSKKLKKLTLLHSNDIHGKFTGKKDENGKLSCSLAQVAGYVNKIKEEQPDTLYCIAGDVFQGSLIDSDFQGLSTMEILNMLPIDIMSLGNHELDYGISHMLFVAKCADFPIVNTNFKIRTNGSHMFEPYHIVEVDGFHVLFIGLLTENIVDQTKAEGLVGSFVTVEDPAAEVTRITSMIRESGLKVDLTVLLTHIGYDADVELAKTIDPECGVDVIVGGHSHTYLKEPTICNNILIVQAGMEDTHIGKLDMVIDTVNKSIDSWEWEMVPVDEEHCPTDKLVKAMVGTYELEIDAKYSEVVTRLSRKLDNYGRGNATELGQLYADCFRDALNFDVMLLASSSMRCYYLEMTVTLQDLRESYPYDGKIYRLNLSGKQLKRMIKYMLRDEVLVDWKETFYQTSSSMKILYNYDSGELQLWVNGKEIEDDTLYVTGMQEFYFANSEIGFGMTLDEMQENGEARVATTDAFGALRDYLSVHKNLGGKIDDRFIVKGKVPKHKKK
ncbi:MAG: bifunctional metallophosphatase/5'-nucleotidase [Mogibacterium sp.]|nr:bifunctional metallophosphatase/5'-nucleotidase [Mogibacterium sp.]